MTFRDKCLKGLLSSGRDGRCLIIGEVAQSHDGSLGMAHAFIDAIAASGADAVKFQTHIAAEESTLREPWRIKFSRQDETRYAYWQRMEFTREQWQGLKQHADDCGILFLSTPFSEAAADMLASIGMKAWKVASGEVSNIPLLKRMISSGDPVILSSGMSTWEELDSAVKVVRENGNPLAVLQCTSNYPCPPERVGLNMLEVIRQRYELPVGLSDHSGEIFAGLAAVTLGAEVLEVHVTLSREMFGPDVPVSITTASLRQLVDGVRQVEKMIASPVDKEAVADELEPLRDVFTKSVVASTDIPAGTVLESHHLKMKKPGTGLGAEHVPALLGMKLLRSLKADDALCFEDLDRRDVLSISDPGSTPEPAWSKK